MENQDLNKQVQDLKQEVAMLKALVMKDNFDTYQIFNKTMYFNRNAIFRENIQFADKNVVLGTTTGTKFGTSASQKIGFLGATPVVQQTGGAQTAGAAYGATEQGMLQTVYNALRTFGFLS